MVTATTQKAGIGVLTAANPVTMKRLVVVKGLIRTSTRTSALASSGIQSMLDVISLDLAAETLLKAVYWEFNDQKQPDDKFQSLVQSVGATLQKRGVTDGLPGLAKLQLVHNLRNDVQHKARYPSPTLVLDCRTYIQDFCDEVLSLVWGLSLTRIKQADLLSHPVPRTYLSRAEEELSDGNHDRAVFLSAVILEVLSEALMRALGISPLDHLHTIMVQSHGGSVKPERTRDGAIGRALDLVTRINALSALGIDLHTHQRFHRIAGRLRCSLTVDQNGKRDLWIVSLEDASSASESDAEFCISTAIEFAMSLDEKLGALPSDDNLALLNLPSDPTEIA